ncbi:glycosyltransferase family 2 protein [Pelistega sp. NLN82]|uniref:Glycosyltransferase family 2 protein n=1 Tax=Pelistega ratti TaxID=2652177 RepID=A0A6L9Y8E6_9BURK|nr:glycosyltransferase family A protein [Pelistega ratti]NEN76108.1 glycosyltransferase family 2 protein [Pelistega ratti]
MTSVAVITATIGRESLLRAVQSVKAQTYPCKHYIFVDGEQYFSAVQQLLHSPIYSDVTIIYLPMNTGANNMFNSSINAVAPFLVKEDIICYLDDDNWYDAHHIEQLVRCHQQDTTLDVAYSLRKFIDPQGNFICNDDFESIGLYGIHNHQSCHFKFIYQCQEVQVTMPLPFCGIDANCYSIK